MRNLLLTCMLLAVSAGARADGWVLDNDASILNFVSVKAGTIAEINRFGELAGTIDKDGKTRLTIDLDSVDTAIDIRDQRMREMLFETGKYPVANVILDVGSEILAAAPGAMHSTALEATLELHGETHAVTAEVTVARLAEDRLLVVTRRPVVLDAGAFGLGEGIEALREVAGLSGITPSVPVTFVLVFEPGLSFASQ